MSKLLFFISLLIWIVSFGFFEGHMLAERDRDYGDLLILNLGIQFAFYLVKPYNLNLLFPNYALYYFLIFLLCGISILRTSEFSLNNIANIILTQLVILLMANLAWQLTFRDLLKVFLGFLHITLFLCLIVFLKSGGQLDFGNHTMQGRLSGLFFFADTAIIAGLGALISSYLFTFEKNKYYVFSLVLCLFYLVFTDSRIVMGALIVSLFLLYYFYLKSIGKSTKSIIVLFLGSYLAYHLYITFNTMGANAIDDLSFRTQIWQVAMVGIAQSPLFGYGNTQYFFLSNFQSHEFYYQLKDPHSSYLALILQSGLIVFIVWSNFIFRIFNYLFNKVNSSKRSLISFLSFMLIVGITGGTIFNLNYSLLSVLFEFVVFGIVFHPFVVSNFEVMQLKNE